MSRGGNEKIDKNEYEKKVIEKVKEIRDCFTLKDSKRNITKAPKLIEQAYDLHLKLLQEFSENKLANRVPSVYFGQLLALHTLDIDIKNDNKPNNPLHFFINAIVYADTYRPVLPLEPSKLKPIERDWVYRADTRQLEKRTPSETRGLPKKTPFSKALCYTYTSVPHNTRTYHYECSIALMIDIRFSIIKDYYIFEGNQATNSRWYIPGTKGWEDYVHYEGGYKKLSKLTTTISQLQDIQKEDLKNKRMSQQNEIRAKVSAAGLIGILALAKKKCNSEYRYVEPKVADRLNALFANYFTRQTLHERYKENKELLYLWRNLPTYVLNPATGLEIYSIKDQINDLCEARSRPDGSIAKKRLNSIRQQISDQEIYSPAVKLFFDTYINTSTQAYQDFLDKEKIAQAITDGYPRGRLTFIQDYLHYYSQDHKESPESLTFEKFKKILFDILKNKPLNDDSIKYFDDKNFKFVREEGFIHFLAENKYFRTLSRYIYNKIHIETESEQKRENVLDCLIRQENYDTIYALICSCIVNLSDSQLTPKVQKALLTCAFASKNHKEIDTILELKNADINVSYNFLKENEHYEKIIWLSKRHNFELSGMTFKMQIELLICAIKMGDADLYDKLMEFKNIDQDKEDNSQTNLIQGLFQKIKEKIDDYEFLCQLLKLREKFKDKFKLEEDILKLLIEGRHYKVIYQLISSHEFKCTDISIQNWEIHANLSNLIRAKKDYIFLAKMLKHNSEITDEKAIKKMSDMFICSSLDHSIEARKLVESLENVSLEYLCDFSILIDKDIVRILIKIMDSNYYSEKQKWHNIVRIMEHIEEKINIVNQVCHATFAKSNYPYYQRYLLRLISQYCGKSVEKEQSEQARIMASALLKAMINRCEIIPQVMYIVNTTEAKSPDHSWGFLQKRRSKSRLSTMITYYCNNGIEASETWIGIMIVAQVRIMNLARSATVLKEDESVIKFLEKRTGLLNSLWGNTAAEYKLLCKTRNDPEKQNGFLPNNSL